MNRRILTAAMALSVSLPGTLAAQDGGVVQSLKGLHDLTTRNLMATAETLDEKMFAYRPTEEVRSAGEILAHVANSQYLFCSSAAGQESPSSEDLEETATTKGAITAALGAAFAYCSEVYDGMSDDESAEMISFFGGERARAAVLAFNSAHNYEHYGNLVTYMRMNGIVPPSSR